MGVAVTPFFVARARSQPPITPPTNLFLFRLSFLRRLTRLRDWPLLVDSKPPHSSTARSRSWHGSARLIKA